MRVLGWWMSLADFSVPIWLEQLADLQWNPSCSPSLTLSRSEAEGPEIVNQPVSAMPSVIHPENRQWMAALAEKEGFHFLHKVPEHPQPCCPCPITAHVCLDLSCWCAPNTETDMLLTMKRVPFLLHCGLELLSSLEIFARNMFMFSNGRKMSARWCLIIQSHPLLTYCNTFIVSKYLFQKNKVALPLVYSFHLSFLFLLDLILP